MYFGKTGHQKVRRKAMAYLDMMYPCYPEFYLCKAATVLPEYF